MVGIICTILSCTIYALDPINIVFKWVSPYFLLTKINISYRVQKLASLKMFEQ